MPFKIYHNPRCSKSRAALQMLEDAGVEAEVIEYLKAPPTIDELDAICRQLKVEPQDLIRFKETVAKDLGLAPTDKRPRSQWLNLIVKHPILLERPIVVRGNQARLGRPPEAIRDLLPK